jgi:hypothetical protein
MRVTFGLMGAGFVPNVVLQAYLIENKVFYGCLFGLAGGRSPRV